MQVRPSSRQLLPAPYLQFGAHEVALDDPRGQNGLPAAWGWLGDNDGKNAAPSFSSQVRQENADMCWALAPAVVP